MTQGTQQPQMAMGQYALGAAASIVFHPITYTKVLIQLGHEPLPAVPSSTIFGRKVLAYPSVFKYLGHIKKRDGFFGLYRGLGARLVGGVAASYVSNQTLLYFRSLPNPQKEIDEDDDALEAFKHVCRETSYEMVARCAAAVVSQPFQVIMVRSMAQFVGGEDKYNGICASVVTIYKEEGLLGFFAGLLPRLVGEVLTVWMVNTLLHVLENYLIPKSQSPKGVKSYATAVCTMLVSQLTYPLTVVSNVMAVSGTQLAAGNPPNMEKYGCWLDCFSDLRAKGQLKRGSSLFWRYYSGPVVFRHDGRPMPANKLVL